MLYGSKFWKEVINFDALVKHGVIGEDDLNLFRFADDPTTALDLLRDGLTKYYLEPEEALAAHRRRDSRNRTFPIVLSRFALPGRGANAECPAPRQHKRRPRAIIHLMSDQARQEFSFRNAYQFLGRVGIVFLSRSGRISHPYADRANSLLSHFGQPCPDRDRHLAGCSGVALRAAALALEPAKSPAACVRTDGNTAHHADCRSGRPQRLGFNNRARHLPCQSELNRKLEAIHAAAESFEKVPVEHRSEAASNIIDYFKQHFPNIRPLHKRRTGSHAYPEGTPSA